MSNTLTSDRISLDKFKKIKKVKKFVPLYILMAFPLLHLFMLKIVPLFGIAISFQRYRPTKGIFGSTWVGFDNFTSFFNSNYFELVLKNTLLLNIIGLVVSFPLPIIFALILNEVRHTYFKKTVQLVTYAPHFISIVVLVGIMQQLFDPTTGILQFFIGKEAASQVLLMSDPNAFRALYIISGIWQGLGWSSVLYTASLSNVNLELYDAAKVDGVSILQKIWYIDFPCILPVVSISLIMATGGIMNTNFDKIYLMQTNTNAVVSEVISTLVYKKGLIQSDFGYSSAIGLFNSVINMILILVTNFIVKKTSNEGMF